MAVRTALDLAAIELILFQSLFGPFEILGDGKKWNFGAFHLASLIILKRIV